MTIQNKDIIVLHRATGLPILQCKAALIKSDGNIPLARQLLEHEAQAVVSESNSSLERKEELPLAVLEQVELLNTRLNQGLISIDQLKLAAYLEYLPASILVDNKLDKNKYSNDQTTLGDWLYGLSIGGKTALVHVCLIFAKLSLDGWSSAEEQGWEGFRNYSWFGQRRGRTWRKNCLKTFLSAVQLVELWNKQPNDKALEQVISIQINLNAYYSEIVHLEDEGIIPNRMFNFATAIYFMFSAAI